jgi:isopropylmalate/homocitrate/citramalate synthase
MTDAQQTKGADLPVSPVNPYNRLEQLRAAERFHLPITVVDVTLREGQQAAEVAFGPRDEVEFAQALQRLGVPVVQAGYAGADDASVRRLRDACPDLRLAVLAVGWDAAVGESIASARDAGANICSILFRSADRHLANLGYTRQDALARVAELVRIAAQAGYEEVAFGPSFATLADESFLMGMYASALESGATIVSLADSSGTATPATVVYLVERMRMLAGSAGVRIHMHNDFGLALANTLAGLAAGADWVEVTVNGLGERAGNCCLEEVVVALEVLYGVNCGIDTTGLFELSRLVERLTGVAVPPMKPIVGGDVFSNKLEIHVKAAMKDPSLMEPFDPALVGNARTIRLGRGTGPTGVRMRLAQLGVELDDTLTAVLVERINELAVTTKRSVDDEQLRLLFAELEETADG